MKLGLVLGGGGLVGMAYHAGVLKALDDEGIDVARADVLVGTSAGSILASYMASGWHPTDFYEYAHGRHVNSERSLSGQQDEVRQVFVPLYHSTQERVRRSIGSMFALASSRGVWPGGKRGAMPSAALRHLFPAGLYSTERTRERLHEDLPAEWPREGLFICGADLYSGKLVAFGTPGAPEATLPEAVLASTAIPGLFPPVRIGDRQYVDGGVVSATSLNLAVEAGCEAILCVAPLGYLSEGELIFREPKVWPAMLVRSLFARSLRREVNEARAKGVEVFVIRPWLRDLQAHGSNSMRFFDRAALSDSAREGTKKLLDERSDEVVLAAFAQPQRAARERAG